MAGWKAILLKASTIKYYVYYIIYRWRLVRGPFAATEKCGWGKVFICWYWNGWLPHAFTCTYSRTYVRSEHRNNKRMNGFALNLKHIDTFTLNSGDWWVHHWYLYRYSINLLWAIHTQRHRLRKMSFPWFIFDNISN